MSLEPRLGHKVVWHHLPKKSPELGGVRSMLKVSQLMSNHIFQHLLWSKDQMPIDQHVTLRPARTPANGQFGHTD